MKKLLSILCAVAMMIAPYNVYAQEIYGDGQATTTVIAHVDSQYCVTIPETIVADGEYYYFTASLMDLAEGDVVNVSLSGLEFGQLPMSGGNGSAYAFFESEEMTIANDVPFVKFHNGETIATNGLRAILQDAYHAGDYSGTVTFNISLGHE